MRTIIQILRDVAEAADVDIDTISFGPRNTLLGSRVRNLAMALAWEEGHSFAQISNAMSRVPVSADFVPNHINAALELMERDPEWWEIADAARARPVQAPLVEQTKAA